MYLGVHMHVPRIAAHARRALLRGGARAHAGTVTARTVGGDGRQPSRQLSHRADDCGIEPAAAAAAGNPPAAPPAAGAAAGAGAGGEAHGEPEPQTAAAPP